MCAWVPAHRHRSLPMKKDVGGRFGGDVMVGSAPRTEMEKQVLRDLYERGCIDDPKLGDFEGFWYFAEGLDKKC